VAGWQTLTPSDQVEAADWIRERLHGFALDVGSVVPPGFAAYARIFHPAAIAGEPEAEIGWSAVAALSGKAVHPEMQFHAIAPAANDPEPRIYEPRLGVLSTRQTEALVRVLSKHTTTPESCCLCLWDGYGYLHPGGIAWMVAASGPFARTRVALKRFQLRLSRPRYPRRDGPRVRLPARDYLLFRAPIAKAVGWEDGPNLWWPDDHAWCVASEIDFPYTYVGGSQGLIAAILEDPAIESLAATDRDGISYSSDTINS
jgi:hypothetical protein